MEVEKRGMKGGFFQLFDWNAKSRKKLFSSKSDPPESSNSGKENYRSSLIGRNLQELEKGFLPKAEGDNSYHYSGPSNGDPECGKKAPGVVARLMGLDSLPNSNVNDPFLSPFLGPHIFRDPGYLMSPQVLPGEHDIVVFESVRNKLDGLKQNPLEHGVRKAPSMPIERFQTEVLPHKSAKPACASHHRLLSPIKTPGFVPPKNAAYIIEAATKMIEQSPRSMFKETVPAVGSSVTFRNRDLRERMEAVERSSRTFGMPYKAKELNSGKKNQVYSRVQERSEDNFRSSEECRGVGSQRSRVKDRAGSPAVQQGKMSIQRRNGSVSVSSKSFGKQKEHNDAKLASSSRNITDPPKREKRNTSRSSEALRLNNQKQNRASAEGNDTFESPFCHSKMRKESNPSTINPQGRVSQAIDKIVVSNIVTSRKMNIVAPDTVRQSSSLSPKNSGKKKLPTNGNVQMFGNADEKATQMKASNSSRYDSYEANSEWDEIGKKKTLDVVSFTFTSPIKKSCGGSNLRDTIFASDSSMFPSSNLRGHGTDFSISTASSSGVNATVSGDSLSALLEQKLRELTSNVLLSQEQSRFSAPTYGSEDVPSSPSSVKFMQNDNNACINKQQILSSTADCASSIGPWSNDLETLECLEANCHGINMEHQKSLTPQASLSFSSQPSFYGGASDSFEVDESSIEGQYSNEETRWSCTRKSQLTEGEYEALDTASSVSVGALSENTTPWSYMINPKDPSLNWRLLYIGDILENTDILTDELALKQQPDKLIPSTMFRQLENQKKHLYCDTEELERRALFDCVFEWVEGKAGSLLGRSFRVWSKRRSVLRQKQWLAEEVYREISTWANEEEKMVDELVDKDMSFGEGKWIDFEGETFEEGLEIEETVLTCLVNELAEDLF